MSIPENPWFLQAEDDLKMAKLAFANGFYSQTCYHASQSAEKALKSIIIDLGELPPKKPQPPYRATYPSVGRIDKV